MVCFVLVTFSIRSSTVPLSLVERISLRKTGADHMLLAARRSPAPTTNVIKIACTA